MISCHSILVPGSLEIFYEEAWAYEFILKASPWRQKTIFINYKGKDIDNNWTDYLAVDEFILM